MILLGHLGITTAIIKKCEKYFNADNIKIDYRVVLFASVLPDIIDKPAALLLMRSHTVNTRLFGHTLIFTLLLIITGYIYSTINNNSNVLILGLCSFIHLILDSMWLFPHTFLYPLYGFKFPLQLQMGNFPNYLSEVFSLPILSGFEVIGWIILIYYSILSKKHLSFYRFLKYGEL